MKTNLKINQQNFKITIMFDGSNFFGWAKQTKERTIQGQIEKILSNRLAQKIKIIGCSRTDRQVHSEAYVFNFITTRSITKLKLENLLMKMLPPDISLIAIALVDLNFHARFSALQKTYRYQIVKQRPSPFEQRYYGYIGSNTIDSQLIKDAIKIFIGQHDFTGFSAYNKSVEDMICRIDKFSFNETKTHYYFTITGNRFLKYMVRIIVANLISVGTKKTTKENLLKILDDCNRNLSNSIVVGNGLFLSKVIY